MSIEFACECGKRLKVRNELAGGHGKCPACGKVLKVPGTSISSNPMPMIPREAAETQLPSEPHGGPRGGRRVWLWTFSGALLLVLVATGVLLWSNSRPKVRHVTWYTAPSLRTPLGLGSISLPEEAKNAGFVFLVVEAEIAGEILATEDKGTWYDLSTDISRFTIKSPDGSERIGEGFGFMNGFQGPPPVVFEAAIPAPERWRTMIVFFVVKSDLIDKGGQMFQVKNAPAVILDASNQKQAN